MGYSEDSVSDRLDWEPAVIITTFNSRCIFAMSVFAPIEIPYSNNVCNKLAPEP